RRTVKEVASVGTAGLNPHTETRLQREVVGTGSSGRSTRDPQPWQRAVVASVSGQSGRRGRSHPVKPAVGRRVPTHELLVRAGGPTANRGIRAPQSASRPAASPAAAGQSGWPAAE